MLHRATTSSGSSHAQLEKRRGAHRRAVRVARPYGRGVAAQWESGHAGRGRPVVLLHSGTSTWREWRNVVPLLADEREVLAPTLPGSYGGPPIVLGKRSMLQVCADYVEQLLDERGWTGPVTIAGSSHGAVTALELAARGRASDVVALAPPWTTAPILFAYGAMVLVGTFPLRSMRRLESLTWTRTPLAVRFRLGGVMLQFSSSAPLMSEEDLLATFRSTRDYPFLQLGVSALREPTLPDVAAVTCPVTIARGTGDRTVPAWMTQRWAQAIPHAVTVDLPGLRHVPHLTDPERVAALIAQHAGDVRG